MQNKREEIVRQLVDDISSSLQEDILKSGAASLLVSGGSTPVPMFELLSQQDIEWDKVFISLVDERWVPNDHQDQNGSMVLSNLIQNKAKSAHFVPLVHDSENEVKNLAMARVAVTELPRPFSVVVLGMGNDGHTASLFPDAPELIGGMDLSSNEDLISTHPKSAPHSRITFTRKSLLDANCLMLHIHGMEKHRVLEAAKRESQFSNYPITGFIHQVKSELKIYWSE